MDLPFESSLQNYSKYVFCRKHISPNSGLTRSYPTYRRKWQALVSEVKTLLDEPLSK